MFPNCDARVVCTFLLFLVPALLTTGGCSGNSESSDDAHTQANAGSGTADGSAGTVVENAKLPKNGEICTSCHEEQAKFWAYGGHSAVACETCHGVKGDHVAEKTKPIVRGNDQCVECHELVKEPGAEKLSEAEVFERHMQFVEKKHVIEVKREKVRDRCIYCHDPHLGQ